MEGRGNLGVKIQFFSNLIEVKDMENSQFQKWCCSNCPIVNCKLNSQSFTFPLDSSTPHTHKSTELRLHFEVEEKPFICS